MVVFGHPRQWPPPPIFHWPLLPPSPDCGRQPFSTWFHHYPPEPPSTTLAMSDMMIPWLHFTSGDNLLFEAWHPSSPGAIAGACIGLALLAIFERWISAVRGMLDVKWRKRFVPSSQHLGNVLTGHAVSALAVMSSTSRTDRPSSDEGTDTSKCHSAIEEVDAGPSLSTSSPPPHRGTRSYPPFIASHDIPRGAIFAFQALLYYILMLVVM